MQLRAAVLSLVTQEIASANAYRTLAECLSITPTNTQRQHRETAGKPCQENAHVD
jgi:hypothetical protein